LRMPKRVLLWLQRLGRTFTQCGDARRTDDAFRACLALKSARFGQHAGAPCRGAQFYRIGRLSGL
jgi:hypothetical protein